MNTKALKVVAGAAAYLVTAGTIATIKTRKKIKNRNTDVVYKKGRPVTVITEPTLEDCLKKISEIEEAKKKSGQYKI